MNRTTQKAIALIYGVFLFCATAQALPWTTLATHAPGNVQTMILMSDGTVLAHDGNSGTWYRLTPDAQGHYVNGSWSTAAAMTSTRRFFSSAVLTDGRLLVAGAEYGTGWNTAEVYNPLTNQWTSAPVANGLITNVNNPVAPNFQNTAGFSDSVAMMQQDGTVLVGPVYPVTGNGTVVYDPATNTWSAGPIARASQNEVSWLKLADNSILVIDKGGTTAERLIPASGATASQWVADAAPPAGNLYDSLGSEIGAAILLPDGRGFFLGATGKTAIYSPSGSTAPGTWVQGPDIPKDSSNNAQGAVDAPAAMMVNGKILCAFSRAPYADGTGNHVFNPPTTFYEYTYNPNGGIGSFSAALATPSGGTENITCYQATMLDLPDGNILYSNSSNQLYIYTPVGAPVSSGKPAITGITTNADGSYRLTGRGLNGISAGAAYGDDAQMDSNYPIVRLTSGAGAVVYGRTYSWSSTGVQTGNALVSTKFSLNGEAAIGGGGNYALAIIANGISSDPITFPGPVWVDFSYSGSPQLGTVTAPYQTLAQGISAVNSGGTILLRGSHTSSEHNFTISKPLTIVSNGANGNTIGR